MSRIRLLFIPLFLALIAGAHPMGNFSINHYACIHLGNESTLNYVLDFAEIPTFTLLQEWHIGAQNSATLQLRARAQADSWLGNLVIEDNRRPISPELQRVEIVIQDGAGGMPILRITMTAKLALRSGALEYQDRNYPDRTGWKEIVIRGGRSVEIVSASHEKDFDKDLSEGLTRYPTDFLTTPPQDVTASVKWRMKRPAPVLSARRLPPAVPAFAQNTSKPVPAKATKPAAAPSFAAQQPIAAGTVVKGDFLSHLLQTREIGFPLILIGIAVAFGLGAIHALSPGHGKTIVAAYLVGSRGAIKHAVFLGATVTLTHTMTVFLLGLGVLFFEKYIVPDRIVPWLGAISGLSIVSIGVMLLYQRAKALLPRSGQDIHTHSHPHTHPHTHHDDRYHEHSHADCDEHGDHHAHGPHVHSHSGRPHSHVPDGKITLGSLLALGVSGGLVPCPSALVLLLSAIALGHAGLGLILLIGFSFGLALVLMGIGVLVIYAKQLIPARSGITSHPFFRLVPVFSAIIVVCLGLGMTAISLGWAQPGRWAL